MATQSFPLDQSLANLPLDLLKKKYDELTPEQRRMLGFTRQSTQQQFDDSQTQGGAPADFSGRVLQNPDNAQISDDTDSGIPALRLPNGVTAQTGAYTGTPQLDTSNPAQAQVLQPEMQTIQSEWTPVKTEAAPADSEWKPVAETTHAADKAGFWSALGSDLKGMASGAIDPKTILENAATMGIPVAQLPEVIRNAAEHSKEQKAAGYSLPYRALSPVAEATGANVRGMEESAAQGDIAGVAGHAATVPAVIAATELGAHAVPAVAKAAAPAIEKVKSITPKRAAQVAGGVTGAGLGHGELSVPGAYYGAKGGGKIAESLLGKERANAPIFKAKNAAATRIATSPLEELEGITSPQIEAAGNSPQEHVPQDTAPVKAEAKSAPVERDATLNKRNIPDYAGEEEPAPKNAAAERAKPETVGTPEGAARDTKLFQQAKQELGKDASVSEVAQRAQELKTSPYTTDAPDIRGKNAMRTRADLLEDKSIQESVRNAADMEQLQRLRAARREYQAPTKQELEVKANEAQGKETVEAPVKLTKTPGVNALKSRAGEPPAGTISPGDQDMTAALQKSVEQATSKKPENMRFAYRARDVGEQGIPQSKAGKGSATGDLKQALDYAEPGQRSLDQGEVVRIDLSKLSPSDYVIHSHPNGMKWVEFRRPLGESEIENLTPKGAGTRK